MSMRVSQLAEELGMTPKELLGYLAVIPVAAASPSTALDDFHVALIKKRLPSAIKTYEEMRQKIVQGNAARLERAKAEEREREARRERARAAARERAARLERKRIERQRRIEAQRLNAERTCAQEAALALEEQRRADRARKRSITQLLRDLKTQAHDDGFLEGLTPQQANSYLERGLFIQRDPVVRNNWHVLSRGKQAGIGLAPSKRQDGTSYCVYPLACEDQMRTYLAHAQEIAPIVRYLKQERNVDTLVHFTPGSNIPSILQRGLCPRRILQREGVEFKPTDGKRLEGSGHLNLSLTNPNLNMLYRKYKQFSELDEGAIPFALLYLSLDALYAVDSIRFSLGNAASSRAKDAGDVDVKRLFAGERINHYDAAAAFQDNWTTDNQSEVLAEGTISPRYIMKIRILGSSQDDPKVRDLIDSVKDTMRQEGLEAARRFVPWTTFAQQEYGKGYAATGNSSTRERSAF